MAINSAENQEIRLKTAKPMLWIGIISMIMLFAGLTSAYIVRQAEGNWNYFELPDMFFVSTVIIVISSFSMALAQSAVKRNRARLVKTGLGITLGLGIAFVFSQFSGWGDLVDSGIFFTGPTANASGSYLYVLTGLHLAHLAGGIFALIFTFVKALMEKYNSGNLLGIQLCAIYWHFLGALWVYLLLFLLFIR